jgi:hypothetical protein
VRRRTRHYEQPVGVGLPGYVEHLRQPIQGALPGAAGQPTQQLLQLAAGGLGVALRTGERDGQGRQRGIALPAWVGRGAAAGPGWLRGGTYSDSAEWSKGSGNHHRGEYYRGAIARIGNDLREAKASRAYSRPAKAKATTRPKTSMTTKMAISAGRGGSMNNSRTNPCTPAPRKAAPM